MSKIFLYKKKKKVTRFGRYLFFSAVIPATLPFWAMLNIMEWYAFALVMRKSSVLTVGTFDF